MPDRGHDAGAVPVATDVGDSASIVTGHGFLAPPDPEAIALVWSEAVARGAEFAPALALSRERFSRTRMIAAYAALIEQVRRHEAGCLSGTLLSDPAGKGRPGAPQEPRTPRGSGLLLAQFLDVLLRLVHTGLDLVGVLAVRLVVDDVARPSPVRRRSCRRGPSASSSALSLRSFRLSNTRDPFSRRHCPIRVTTPPGPRRPTGPRCGALGQRERTARTAPVRPGPTRPSGGAPVPGARRTTPHSWQVLDKNWLSPGTLTRTWRRMYPPTLCQRRSGGPTCQYPPARDDGSPSLPSPRRPRSSRCPQAQRPARTRAVPSGPARSPNSPQAARSRRAT